MKKKIVIFRNGSYGDAIVALPVLKLIAKFNKDKEIYYTTILNKETNFFHPKQLFYKFGLNFKYQIYYKKQNYILDFILFFLKNKFNELFYLKEEPTNIVPKILNIKNTFLNIFFEYIFFKCLLVKNVNGLNKKSFKKDNNGIYIKESVNLINRFYTKKFNENNLIKNLYIKNNKTKNEVVICMGGKFKIKDWGFKNWIELLTLINNHKKRIKFILIGGGESDRRKYVEIKKIFKNQCKIFIDKPINKLIDKIKGCKLYIGHDTANMHLASVLGIKTISIFSSREHEGIWFPIGNNNINFYKKISCSNCKLTDFCPFEQKCIMSFLPINVFNRIKKFI